METVRTIHTVELFSTIASKNHWTDFVVGTIGVISSDGAFLYEDEATGDIVPWYAFTGTRDYMEWAVDMRDKGYLRTLP